MDNCGSDPDDAGIRRRSIHAIHALECANSLTGHGGTAGAPRTREARGAAIKMPRVISKAETERCRYR